MDTSETIYDQIGGKVAVETAVELFYSKVLADSTLAPYFAGVDLRRLKSHQEAFLAAALGGPENYFGRDMKQAHDGLRITSDAFDLVVSHLTDTLAELGISLDTIGAIAGRLLPLKSDIVTG